MKIKFYQKLFLLIAAFLLIVYPVQAFAAADSSYVNVSVLPPRNTIEVPPLYEISADKVFAQGYTLAANIVSGGSSITKLSSSSVRCYGYTSCTLYDPAVEVIVSVQAYYSGAWHTLSSASQSASGTWVSKTQDYTVTSGYYYRTHSTHLISSGTTNYSNSGSILVN